MNLQFRDDILNANFRPTVEAHDLEKKLISKMGSKHRYEPIRLMLGRSLLERVPPKPVPTDGRSDKGELKGRALFGDELDLWISIFVLEGEFSEPNIDAFRAAVEAHWARGCQLVQDDLDRVDGDVVQMAVNLANFLPAADSSTSVGATASNRGSSGDIILHVGPESLNSESNKPVTFVLNGNGSPHMVLMGMTGKGKTRVGVHITRQILDAATIPFIYVDPKPDFAPDCQYHRTFDSYDSVATVLVGSEAIPLDFLPTGAADNTSMQSACMRLRDSLCRSLSSVGPKQKDRLLACIEVVARRDSNRSLEAIRAEYESAIEADGEKPDSVSSLLNEINKFNVFEPVLSPTQFFSRSWVLSLDPQLPDSFKTLAMGLLLDCEAAYWLGQPDAPMKGGHRVLRHLLVIDEARRVLKAAKSDSLVQMISRSRSRGCVIMLLSQNPGDFEGAEYDFMSQIGTVIAFACNQSDRGLSALKGVFGRKLMPAEFSDSRLTAGLAFCKLPERQAEIVKAW